MAKISDLNSPSWAIFPVNGNTTAWRSFGVPIILCEPGRRDVLGRPVVNSGVLNVRVVIENVPHQVPVAGHDHVGLLHPDTEIHARTLISLDLAERRIDVEALSFFKADGTAVDYDDAKSGDVFQYTTATGIRDTLTYIPSADYYDLSDIRVETFDLPSNHYYLSYQANHYARVLTSGQNKQLVCIDGSQVVTTAHRFEFNHPGDVIDETVRLTPAPYLTSSNKSEDTTVGLYRPFTDALQDIFDEQELLERLNWVEHIRPEFVPYLSYLLGLDIPFFPGSADKLRQTMLKNVVRLQQLKGSERAILELFELFGYTTKIIHLYWNQEATHLIRPGKELPPTREDEEIQVAFATQIEPLLADYSTDGFGQIKIPLLHIPNEDEEAVSSRNGIITIDALLVEKDSELHTTLIALTDAINADPSGYGQTHQSLPEFVGSGLHGYSQHQVNLDDRTITELALAGPRPPFKGRGISYDPKHNLLDLTFNGALAFGSGVNLTAPNGLTLYTFATYTRQEIILPSGHISSNRFDIKLLTNAGVSVLPNILEFLVDFLFKLKAFHSLLNVVIYNVDFHDTYLVTDLCLGGDFSQRPDLGLGSLQVPPAILPDPNNADGCDDSPLKLGYKPKDVILREAIFNDLLAEHQAWKVLDARAGLSGIGSTNLRQPIDGSRTECIFNPRGQDRVTTELGPDNSEQILHPGSTANSQSTGSQTNKAESPLPITEDEIIGTVGNVTTTQNDSGGFGSFRRDFSDSAPAMCNTDGVNDHCYKGRVSDETLYRNAVPLHDSYHNTPCSVGLGTGVYFELPITKVVTPMTSNLDNMLGRALRSYQPTSSYGLHYANGLDKLDGSQSNRFIAIQRPELGIQLKTLHLPGCRFINMSNLETDFTHGTWTARPWDDRFSSYCSSAGLRCENEPTFLNATLGLDTTGDQVLEYDDVPCTYLGNGRVADVSSLGTHTSTVDEIDVIHSILNQQATGHAAVSLDQICDLDITDESGIIEVDLIASSQIFSSASTCNEVLTDYGDGYPCESGSYTYESDNLGRGLYDDWIEAMEIPQNDGVPTVMFRLGSGIRDGLGMRLDCGCSKACDGTAEEELTCQLSRYLDVNGLYDWSPDQLEHEVSIRLPESIGIGSLMLDGRIPSLFELAI